MFTDMIFFSCRDVGFFLLSLMPCVHIDLCPAEHRRTSLDASPLSSALPVVSVLFLRIRKRLKYRARCIVEIVYRTAEHIHICTCCSSCSLCHVPKDKNISYLFHSVRLIARSSLYFSLHVLAVIGTKRRCHKC